MLDKSVLRIIFHYHVEAGFVQNYKFVHLKNIRVTGLLLS